MSSTTLGEGRQVVLALASDISAPPEEPFPLDRIRLQKAVFLITMRGPSRWSAVYPYRPYDWGPYSDQLTSDVGVLEHLGLLRLRHTTGRYAAHAASPSGNEIAMQYWQTLRRNEQDFVRAVRSYVTHKSFRDLLIEVYAAYPEFATNSRFTG